MFSAYSWGDFIKFVIALCIPYYTFVFWKYYRHDFSEWFSNRGKKNEPGVAAVTEESVDDEDDIQSRFTVSNYDDGHQLQPSTNPAPTSPVSAPQRVEKPVATEWLPASPLSADAIAPMRDALEPETGIDPHQDEVDMSGPDIYQQPEETLGLPLALQSENPEELLLDDVMMAARRIKPDENGQLRPVEANDPVASRLAAQINNQQGINEFADMSFSR